MHPPTTCCGEPDAAAAKLCKSASPVCCILYSTTQLRVALAGGGQVHDNKVDMHSYTDNQVRIEQGKQYEGPAIYLHAPGLALLYRQRVSVKPLGSIHLWQRLTSRDNPSHSPSIRTGDRTLGTKRQVHSANVDVKTCSFAMPAFDHFTKNTQALCPEFEGRD